MKTLVIIAHPDIDQSRINAHLKRAIHNQPDVTVHELYREYLDKRIDIQNEQRLLEDHDRTIFQFPKIGRAHV